jgi:hypothetical protein
MAPLAALALPPQPDRPTWGGRGASGHRGRGEGPGKHMRGGGRDEGDAEGTWGGRRRARRRTRLCGATGTCLGARGGCSLISGLDDPAALCCSQGAPQCPARRPRQGLRSAVAGSPVPARSAAQGAADPAAAAAHGARADGAGCDGSERRQANGVEDVVGDGEGVARQQLRVTVLAVGVEYLPRACPHVMSALTASLRRH